MGLTGAWGGSQGGSQPGRKTVRRKSDRPEDGAVVGAEVRAFPAVFSSSFAAGPIFYASWTFRLCLQQSRRLGRPDAGENFDAASLVLLSSFCALLTRLQALHRRDTGRKAFHLLPRTACPLQQPGPSQPSRGQGLLGRLLPSAAATIAAIDNEAMGERS